MTPLSPELLVDLRERMVRIETKLDVHAETATAARKDIDDHERRLTALEAAYKVLAAVGAILLFLVTFFQAKITAFFG